MTIKMSLSEMMWELRNEIAELRKERRKLLMEQPFEPEDDEILADLDKRLDELCTLHDETEAALRVMNQAAQSMEDTDA